MTHDPMQGRSDGIGALLDFSFSRFLTPSLVKIIYALVFVLMGIGWLIMVVSGFSQGGFKGGLMALIFGTLVMFVYLLMMRVSLELMIVIFRLGDDTKRLVALEEAKQRGGA